MREEIYIELFNNKIYLDKRCWACIKGVPNNDTFTDEFGVCEICEGTGFELTNNGQAVMDMMKRHGGGKE